MRWPSLIAMAPSDEDERLTEATACPAVAAEDSPPSLTEKTAKDASAKNLRSQTGKSIAWVFSSTAAIALSRVVLFAGLARLLQPSDFGLYAATTSVLGILEIL